MKVPLALRLLRVCTALILVVGLGGTAQARHHGKSSSHDKGAGKRALAEGRRHLKKANAYAGANKCWSAIPEYTAAYLNLGDPVVLFNRADCYRRVGENERAIADYRGFLKALPKASNTADVEARIAALEGKAGLKPIAEDAAPAKDQPKKEPPKPDEKSPVAAATPAPPPARPPSPPPTVVAAAPPTEEQAIAPELLAVKDPAPAVESPALVSARSEPVVVARADKPKKRGYWWVWVLAGAVAAGGGATAFLMLRPHPAAIPPTELGNYHF